MILATVDVSEAAKAAKGLMTFLKTFIDEGGWIVVGIVLVTLFGWRFFKAVEAKDWPWRK